MLAYVLLKSDKMYLLKNMRVSVCLCVVNIHPVNSVDVGVTRGIVWDC